MAVEKLSVSLPDVLAGRIDELAELDGVSRSAVIQEAAAQYVASRDAAAREIGRRVKVDEALAAFDAIASNWGADTHAGIEYLADVRGESTFDMPDDAASSRG
ncbi:MAG: ribbon-helix-helix protein, CopG family [Coriobacteriia bacterium]|nr:ribbon-helix-helix protein, CopG family [Coriobacteriia bacterium]